MGSYAGGCCVAVWVVVGDTVGDGVVVRVAVLLGVLDETDVGVQRVGDWAAFKSDDLPLKNKYPALSASTAAINDPATRRCSSIFSFMKKSPRVNSFDEYSV